MSEIHQYDIGTAFRMTIYDESNNIVNVSGTSPVIIFTKPDKTVVEKSGTIYTDGEDGKIQYVSEENDLDTVGQWQIQAFIYFSDSTQLYSNISTFRVYRNLEQQ